MFDRFTDKSREAMGYSRNVSQEYNTGFIGVTHIIIGILEADPSLSEKLGFDRNECIKCLKNILPKGIAHADTGSIPFSEHAKATLQCALEYTIAEQTDKITPLHLLYGAITTKSKTEEGSAALQLLTKYGVNSDIIHKLVFKKTTEGFRGFNSIEDFAAATCDADSADRVMVKGLTKPQQRTLIELINSTPSGSQPYKIETEMIFPKSGDPFYNLTIYSCTRITINVSITCGRTPLFNYCRYYRELLM